MKKHFENLKEFDAYYKPIDDYHERTLVGGTGKLQLENMKQSICSSLKW